MIKKKGRRLSADRRFKQTSGRQTVNRGVKSHRGARGSQSLVHEDSHGSASKRLKAQKPQSENMMWN